MARKFRQVNQWVWHLIIILMYLRKVLNYFLLTLVDGDIKKYLKNGQVAMDTENDNLYTDDRYSVSQDTIFEDFRGVSLLRTKCLECEQITERKETFCDICVPIETITDCGERKFSSGNWTCTRARYEITPLLPRTGKSLGWSWKSSLFFLMRKS